MDTFYQSKKNKYVWKERGELTIASCTSLDKAKLVKQLLEEGKSLDNIKEIINDGATIHVLFSSGILEEGSSKLPIDYEMKIGVSKIFNDKKNQYTILKLDKLIPPSNKELKETRGEVINDYQNYLEENWVKSLRERYKIEIDKRAYSKLKKQYGS